MSKHILVVDDDPGIRKLYTRALEDTPYMVDTAESGDKALRMHKIFNYDLIFLDLYMPLMSGIEVIREIRMTDMDVPIYIVTSFYKEFLEEITKALNDGLKFEITHKSNTLEKIALIAKETLEGLKIDPKSKDQYNIGSTTTKVRSDELLKRFPN